MSSLLVRMLSAAGVGCCAIAAIPAHAQQFNAGFLRDLPGAPKVDVSYFEKNAGPPPGVYEYDLRLMGKRQATMTSHIDDHGQLLVTPQMLDAVGVDLKKVPALVRTQHSADASPDHAAAAADQAAGKAAVEPAPKENGTAEKSIEIEAKDLANYIPGASVKVIGNENAVDFTIPGQYLKPNTSDAAGNFDPTTYSEGTTAAFVSYNVMGSQTHSDQGSNDLVAGTFNYGISGGERFGGWNFYGNGAYSRTGGASSELDFQNNYVTKDLPRLRGRISLGQLSEGSVLFGGYSLNGVNLHSDMAMYPALYAQPSAGIAGIANTNATVLVYRNGRLLTTRSVPPGPFTLDDVLSTLGAGTFDIVLREANGSERHWQITTNNVQQLLHRGVWQYNFSTGIPTYSDDKTPLLQGEVAYGLSDGLTVLGGLALHDRYRGIGGGFAASLGRWGGVNLQVALAQSRLRADSASGASVTASYEKQFDDLGFNLSATRTFGHYRTLQTTLDTRDDVSSSSEIDAAQTLLQSDISDPVGLYQANVSAVVPGGSLSASIARSDYRDQHSLTAAAVAYNLQLGRLGSLSLAYSMTVGGGSESDRRVMAVWSLPLGQATNVGYTFANEFDKGITQQAFVSGSDLGSRQQWSYSAQAQTEPGSRGLQGTATYRGRAMQLTGTVYQSNSGRNLSLIANGSIVAHAHGITLTSQNISDSYVIVDAHGLPNVGISNEAGLKTDSRGYAIVGDAMPYRDTAISLDTKDFPAGEDVHNSQVAIRVRHGAAAMASFDVFENRRALATIRRKDGSLMTFGAYAEDARGNNIGWIGQDGQAFLQGLKSKDNVVRVIDNGSTCWLNFDLPQKSKSLYDALNLTCENEAGHAAPPAQPAARATVPAEPRSGEAVSPDRATPPSTEGHARPATGGTAGASLDISAYQRAPLRLTVK
jgi:outer membrane usher protein